MINKYLATCDSCKQKFIFRAVVPLATTDSLRFSCPECESELWANLTLDYSVPKMDLAPQGFILDDLLQEYDLPIITVATDLPVHKVKHVLSLPEGGSPFLWMHHEMGAAFPIWREKVDSLQSLRHGRLHDIRRLLDYCRISRWDNVRKCIEESSKDLIPLNNEFSFSEPIKSIHLCYRIISCIYTPLVLPEKMLEFLEEYYAFLNDCINTKDNQYKNLIGNWRENPEYQAFRSKILGTFLRVFDHFDAFIVGLLYEEMPPSLQERIDEYRIFRDDYLVIKALYQDIFELTSQLTVFLGAIINLSIRNDSCLFSNGDRSFNRFKRRTAFERLQILSEVPRLNTLLSAVSRPMRNTIGHFSAYYDCRSGDLQYDDGTNINYIVFLGQFFTAVKALWFMLIFVEKMDIDWQRYLK